MTDEFIPTLTHATERDIDLLLVEELFASNEFVEWMAKKAGLPADVASSTVLHSKRRTRNRREIDIFVDLVTIDRTRAALLIENKLDASEQPDQAESYREELDVVARQFAHAAMLITCPENYRHQHGEFTSKFDAVVTYEELAEYFSSRSGNSGDGERRMRFRADLLDQAVQKHRRGYRPVPNEIIGDFNARYVDLLAKEAPEIIPGKTMLKPANPDESVSMIFDVRKTLAALPNELRPTRFAHEFGRGQGHRANYVAVTFGGWGPALKRVKDVFSRDAAELSANFAAKPPTKTRPNPGLVMSCPTAPIDNQGDFAAQLDGIVSGIRTASRLRAWLLTNVELLRRWKAQVEAGV